MREVFSPRAWRLEIMLSATSSREHRTWHQPIIKREINKEKNKKIDDMRKYMYYESPTWMRDLSTNSITSVGMLDLNLRLL